MAPRRIVPHLISTEVSTAGQTPQLQQAVITSPRPVQSVTLKDQAGEAAKLLGPGRHVYVELAQENTEVDWQKLLRQQGLNPKKKAKDDQQQLAGALPAMPGADPIFKQDNPKRDGGQSVLSRVIHKLEQQFVINGQDDSEDEEEDAAEKGSEEAIADTDDDDAGKDEDQGGFNDLYDMDDDFIDDDELQDYYGGDRRKTKYSGFFINKGEIEKTDEEIAPAAEPPPKRRRRAKKPEDGAAKPGEPAPKKGKRARSDEAEEADQAAEKPRKSRKPKKDQAGPEAAHGAAPAGGLLVGQAAQAPGSSAPACSALPNLPGAGEAARPVAGASEADAAAASATATQSEPAPKGTSQAEKLFGADVAQLAIQHKQVARKSGGGTWPDLPSHAERGHNGLAVHSEQAAPDGAQESELNKEVLASIKKLKRAAEKYGAPAAEANAAKRIPPELKAPIKAFSLAVMRQHERSKTALDSALDAVMPAMQQSASRRDFQVRIKADWHKVNIAADRAMNELKAEVDRCLQQSGQPTAVDDDFAAPQGDANLPGWVWDEHRKTLLWEALTKLQQVKGGPLTPGRGVRIFAKVAEVFPAGSYSKDDLRDVYNEMKEARAARPKEAKQGSVPPQAEPSQHSSEPLSSHPSTPFSSALHSSQSRPNSAAVRPASAASPGQALTQLAGNPAGRPRVRMQPPAAQQPSQPAPAIASVPPASAAMAVPAQAPPQPAVTRPAPAITAPTGGACGVHQQGGPNGTSQPEVSASQPAASLQGVHSQLSDEEYAARMERAMGAAAAHGADRAVLQAAVATFKRGSLKAILNEVLMHTGPEGLTVAEIIEKANSLGLAEPAWEPTTSKKSHMSSILNNEPLAFAHIGKYKYAHIAHKGVVHIPHMRGSRKAEPSQRPAPPQPDRPTAAAAAVAGAGASLQLLQQVPGSSGSSLGDALPSVIAPLLQPLAGALQQAGMAPPLSAIPSSSRPFMQGVPSRSVAQQNKGPAAAAEDSMPLHADPAAPVTQ